MTRSTQDIFTWKELVPALLTVSGIITVALVAGLGFQFQPGDRNSEDTSSNIITVNTLVAQRSESIEQSYAYPGVIKASRTAELSFDRAGRVAKLMVSHGTTVAQNAPVAELERERLESRQASLQSARDRAADSLTDLDPDAPALTETEMQAKIQVLRTELNRLANELSASNHAALGQLPNRQLQQQLQAVETRINMIKKASRQQQVNELRKLIDELDGELADVDFQLAGCRLKAPFAGVVAKRHVDEGTVVSAGMPIVRLIAADSLEVWLGIPIELAATIEEGQSHAITIHNQQYQGVVTARLPEVDRNTRSRTAIFRLDATLSDGVFPGEVARVELSRRIDSDGFWLPLTAMMREARGLWSVFVVEPNDTRWIVSRRYVEVIHLEIARVFVRGTLDSGDLVVAEGTHRVVPGQQVRYNEVSQATEPPANRLP